MKAEIMAGHTEPASGPTRLCRLGVVLLIVVIMRLRAVAVAAGGDQTSRHGRRDAEVPMQTVSDLNEAF